jgi:hypothetical protein
VVVKAYTSNRLPAQIGAVEFEQVEGVEEVTASLRRRQHVKPGEPALITADQLSVDQAGCDSEVVHLDHERELVGAVIASPGHEPDADGIPTRHKAIAVVLNFVDPVSPRWRTVGR